MHTISIISVQGAFLVFLSYCCALLVPHLSTCIMLDLVFFMVCFCMHFPCNCFNGFYSNIICSYHGYTMSTRIWGLLPLSRIFWIMCLFLSSKSQLIQILILSYMCSWSRLVGLSGKFYHPKLSSFACWYMIWSFVVVQWPHIFLYLHR